MSFTGFTSEALQFLVELAANNERAWFQPRKAEFERLLKRPLEELCVDLGERFVDLDIPLVAEAARSPFRIYRDVRFSKDKSPYKTFVSASFPWATGGTAGYFSLQPGEIFFGGGMYHAAPARLAAWRAAVATRPAEVHAVLDDPAFVRVFGTVEGERLKRMPAGFPADSADGDLLRLKDVIVRRRLSDAEAMSADLPDRLADGFGVAVPLFGFLAGLAGEVGPAGRG